MTIIGITGPTGAGKTTALNELEKLGGVIIDCDAVYHELLKSNQTLQDELQNRFGVLMDENGVFDRKKLGAVVFHDPAALADLNAIAFRYVVEAVKVILAKAEEDKIPAAAIDAIALFESGLADLCQATVAITAPAHIRVERIMAREGISREYAQARVNAQNPEEFYTSRCQHTLRNDCASAAEFGLRAEQLFRGILNV
jgi:dephospho-CoA kinase